MADDLTLFYWDACIFYEHLKEEQREGVAGGCLDGSLTPRQIYERINGPVSDRDWAKMMGSPSPSGTSSTRIKIGK